MDDRAVAMPIQYVMLVATVAILSSALFVATGGFVESQQDAVVRQGLEVVGERLATDLTAADRLAQRLDGDGTLELAVDIPSTVGGSYYVVTFDDEAGTDRTWIRLEAADPSVIVEVAVVTDLEIQETTVDGGRIVIQYDAASDTLEVRDA